VADLVLTNNEVPHLALLKFFGEQTGLRYQLRPYERMLTVKVNHETGKAALLIETFIVKETRRSVTFLKRGRKLVGFHQVEVQGIGANVLYKRWMRDDYEPFVLWDDDFTPTEDVHLGTVLSNKERAEKREWEGMAYRVGSKSSPMDNAERTAAGYTTDAMTRHWK